ncbi:pirin [Flavobacterium sp. JLP]|uniref:pirin family protein n=1 Tax=unclassified Flavobacterium TaxID=196869 RepID=UPI00188DA03C|nr:MULTISPECIES: pirin [unclassified Flavobacterium]MBF4492483.1 pirin [Flavobacterium sp. MR2016-29]MBF4506238.1 pirin [Flavobacterium sp. JLP]
MIVQIPTQIYKSDARGALNSANHNCFATFNFEHYQDLSRNAFGSLKILNEVILAPQQRITRFINSNSNVIILPLFGGIDYKDNIGNEEFLRVEQIRVLAADDDLSLEIFNPYKSENVSYLEIAFQMGRQYFKNYFQQYIIDFSKRNKLNLLFEIERAIGFIGIYDGRKEGFYALKNSNNGVFVFVIHGAFEVENRLLEAKDGLGIKKVGTIEWEALSENAILLVMEVPLTSKD